MKRDMDLVRHILIETERTDGPLDISSLRTQEWDDNAIGYHMELMSHHGLLDCRVTRDLGGDVIGGTVDALTWDGADYLDAIRDRGVWAKTKQVVRESVGSTTMEVIRQAAVLVATSAIKAKLGIAP